MVENEWYRRARTVWFNTKDMVEDAKESGESDIIEKAYHNLFLIEETLNYLFGLNDTDFEHWGDKYRELFRREE